MRVTTKLHWRLLVLSLGQVISWGVLYYALLVASPVIAEETGWPISGVTLTFSLGLVVSALVGIPVGRWLDNRGPRLVMTLGSALSASGLLAVSSAPNLVVFGLGWLVVGVAQAAVLYQAAFTVVARRYGTGSRGPMTVLTLAGGLSSTVFAPIVAVLLGVTDWRNMFLILAAVLFVTTVPLHWFGLERTWKPRTEQHTEIHSLSSVIKTRKFWMLELSMFALVGSIFATTLAVIPLFMEKGLTFELSAWALGLLGAGQVIGRLLFFALPRRGAPWVALSVTAALASVSLFALGVIDGPVWLLVLVAIFAGAIRGAQTLVQASSVVDRWGAAHYGTINGFFAAPLTILIAVSPALGPLLAGGLGSFAAMAVASACFAAVAAVIGRFS